MLSLSGKQTNTLMPFTTRTLIMTMGAVMTTATTVTIMLLTMMMIMAVTTMMMIMTKMA